MPLVSILCGSLLVMVGILGYLHGVSSNHASVTALIPAFFGLPIFLVGFSIWSDDLRSFNNPKLSILTPIGSLIAVISFFIPWVEWGTLGITKSASGSELANYVSSFWLFLILAVVPGVIYFIFKPKNELSRGKLFIWSSTVFSILLLMYEFNKIPSGPEILGYQVSASDLGFSIGLGVWGFILGVLFAASGTLFFRDRRELQSTSSRVPFLSPAIRKHLMHVSVVIALFGFLMTAGRVLSRLSDISVSAAVVSQLAMSAICLAFVVFAVRSFIEARRGR